MRMLGIVVAVVLLGGPAQDVYAQSADAGVRGAVLQGANIGDRITVTLEDGAEMRGRLVDAKDALVVRHDADQRTFDFADIARITRRTNGMILGPVIGTAAGLAIGLPARRYFNNEARDGNRALTVAVISGVAIGTLLDALMASDDTIYERPGAPRTTLALAPAKGGITVRWLREW